MHIMWQNQVGTKGSPVASQTSWQSLLDLLDSIWRELYLRQIESFALGTEPRCFLYTRPTPQNLVWSLAGVVGRTVLSRT